MPLIAGPQGMGKARPGRHSHNTEADGLAACSLAACNLAASPEGGVPSVGLCPVCISAWVLRMAVCAGHLQWALAQRPGGRTMA